MIRPHRFIQAMIASMAALFHSAPLASAGYAGGRRCRNRQYTGRYHGQRRYTRGSLPGRLRRQPTRNPHL